MTAIYSASINGIEKDNLHMKNDHGLFCIQLGCVCVYGNIPRLCCSIANSQSITRLQWRKEDFCEHFFGPLFPVQRFQHGSGRVVFQSVL